MPWVKLDDHFPEHPKVVNLGPLGIALQVRALCYCSRNLTDGFVPYGAVEFMIADFPDEPGGLANSKQNPEMWSQFMVNQGVWTEEEKSGGYYIHDYLLYQPSMKSVLKTRKDRAFAGQAGGLAKSKQNPSKILAKVCPVPDPDPDPKDLKSCGTLETGSPPLAFEKKKPDPKVRLIIDCYHSEFEKRHGRPPVIPGKKYGAIALQFLKCLPVDDVLLVIREYFAQPPPWYFEHDLWSLEHILAASNEILARLGRREVVRIKPWMLHE